ncbi:FkbM family methyltransferase [Algoriphagus lacus]|nr:FkbM family methyltransferase [Algoriphagus lacus]
MNKRIYTSLGYRLQNLSTYFKSFDFEKKYGHLIIRRGDSDIRVFKQIFLDEVYHFFPERFDPQVIVDAGANVGYSPVWFASKFPSAKIYAIEPVLSNFRILEKNTGKNPCIIPIQAGLWYENVNLKIHDPKIGSWGFETHAADPVEKAGVEGITISGLMERYGLSRIDLLKIDIEGAEFELFKYNSSEWLSKVNMMMIEVHDRLKPGCSKLIDEVVTPFGFQKFLTKELTIYYKS